MLPVLLRFEWAGITFRLGAYPFMVFCGVVAGIWIALKRAREVDLSPRSLMPVFIGSLFVGFLGARLTYFIQCGGIPFRGGFVLYGGLIAGLLSGLGVARATGLPAFWVADLASPCILLATAFGRLGCLCAGCCYGVVCDGGLSYPRGSHAFQHQVMQGLIGRNAPESLPTVPVTLMESVALLLLFVIASKFWRRRCPPGTVLALVGILYPAWRFVAEFFRADNAPYWGGGLTFSQGISIASLAVSGTFLLHRLRRTAATIVPAFDYHSASVVQFLMLMPLVGVSLGVLSCASHHDREQSHETTGVNVLRKQGPARPVTAGQQSPVKKEETKESDSWFSDCTADCAGDCIDDCIDGCTEAMCSGESSCGGNDQEPVRSVLGALKPRRKYKGSFNIEVVVNERLRVHLKLDGVLSVRKPLPDETIPVHLRLQSFDLSVGEEHWQGSGDLDLGVSPTANVAVLQSTLPPDLMEALESLDGVAGNFLHTPSSVHPATELRRRVQKELETSSPRAGFSMVTTFEGWEKWVVGEATVIEEPPGTYTLRWSIKD